MDIELRIERRLLLGAAIAAIAANSSLLAHVSPTASPKKRVWQEAHMPGKQHVHVVAPERDDVPGGHGSH